ncbi:MAG: type III-A CRISPR-associated protein Csm2 [Chloroflexi bacterium]|nr:MAG: type III-A CRISPR-associated protein Csm2 [Chloroflexota bacterium]
MTQPRQGLERDRQDPRGNRPPAAGLPEGYLRNGYFDAKGNVLPEVIQAWPMELAKTFLEVKPKLNTAQLRRFYAKVRDIEHRLDMDDDKELFQSLKEQIYSLGPIAAAAVGRQNAPQQFKQFIDLNIPHAVRSVKHFKRGFVTHFQSIVAYVRYLEPKS